MPPLRDARVQAREVRPTAVDSPSVLDALAFDLTVADSTESESDGGEQEGSQLPVAQSLLSAQSHPVALAPEAVAALAPERVACAGGSAVLASQLDESAEVTANGGRRLRLQWDPAQGVLQSGRADVSRVVKAHCPHFLRVVCGRIFDLALAGDHVAENLAWKLFGLIPRPRGTGSVGRDELSFRANQFAAGEWVSLVDAARSASVARPAKLNAISTEERRGKAAQNLGPPRTGVSGQARIDRSSIGPPNRRHFCRVARETPTSTSPTHLPRGVGACP